MKAFGFFPGSKPVVEFTHSRVLVLDGEDGIEIEMERLENGQIDPASRERAAARLADFFASRGRTGPFEVLCGIPSRGVSLRRFTLPESAREDVPRLLALQIESQFPLPPEQLAWGYRPAGPSSAQPSGAGATREWMVAAVRKEVAGEYAAFFSGSKAEPVFTLSALARARASGSPRRAWSLLEIGLAQSELAVFEGETPTAVQVLAWGVDSAGAAPAAIAALAGMLDRNRLGDQLRISGGAGQLKEIAAGLERAFAPELPCIAIEVPAGPGRSAATAGLKKLAEESDGDSLLQLQSAAAPGRAVPLRPARYQWAALAAVLAIVAFFLRYAESALGKARVTRKIAEMEAYRKSFPRTDRELDFLKHLEDNQPPLLEALDVIGAAAPRGTRFENIAMNRAGEVSLQGSMRASQETVDFRTKLINSGFFSTVVVDDQTPSPDRQKVTFRISAQWKSLEGRAEMAEAAERASQTNSPAGPTGAGKTNAPAAAAQPGKS